MDYEPTPSTSPSSSVSSNRPGLAIASLVLGLITLLAWCLPICGAPLAIAGIITGILGLNSASRGMAIVGLILSGLGLVLSIVNSVVGVLLAPQFSQMFEEFMRQIPVQP
ncbi:DUF4190 domain-containing protein [uncultured Thermanaerothrix sp.]|uniref:DUF4190 domain-containing protein n=1 Tax=uncultured Thermanaerothrix sp. TaxID=1195149 RepID=UPI00262873E5|nr:DUF4190 domain-containing protein [uncultured Thermanaerothrix sp.]